MLVTSNLYIKGRVAATHMRLRFRKSLAPPGEVARDEKASKEDSPRQLWQFLRWVGPALMVSIAYMDPGNYGTDIAAGAGYKYTLLWAGWLASAMAMLLQYLSGKLGIASGSHLAELVRGSLGGKKRYVIPYWLAAEAAAAATDLAEYLGTVLGLFILFGIPLIYCAIFGALDVIILMTMMTRRFRLVEQYFAILISILVIGIFYDLIVIGHFDIGQVAYGSVVPFAPDNVALFIAVGMIGATVMPHALFVHSWLSKNKMDLLGTPLVASKGKAASIMAMTTGKEENHHPHTSEQKRYSNRLHRNETVIALTIAGVVNAGILLVAVPLFQGNGVNVNLTVTEFVNEMGHIYGPAIGVLFALTLLASGLSSSALGTIAGQIIMEGLIGKRWNIWFRRIITRFVNVFPTTIAILLGLSPLVLLIYSQVILSLMIPLPMIPLVYYTSKRKYMGDLVNRRLTLVLAVAVVVLILFFNSLLLTTLV
jgi:manganese transport protein